MWMLFLEKDLPVARSQTSNFNSPGVHTRLAR